MKVFSTVLLAIVASCAVIEAKTFGKCELAKTLANNGIARASLPDWICLVQHESGFSTTATNNNKNGSKDYGIFQINNKFWCDSSYGSNDCKISCNSLLNDDITDDIKCAKLVHKRHGFNACSQAESKTMKLLFAVVLVLGVSNTIVQAKTFKKCELARVLFDNGISKSLLPDWICLVEHESTFSTTATHKNTDGSTDYGIFQINNKYWCDSDYGANECKIRCKSLLKDDITDAIKCAKLIYSRQGFNAWYGWKDYCDGKPLPDVRSCF
uniref:Lysozyme n=1 Tax=Anopheles minimus TaxID=112268 RepID=A0A182WJG9_9DIPT